MVPPHWGRHYSALPRPGYAPFSYVSLLQFFDGAPGTSVVMTFIVRVSVDEAGGVTSIVERVRTGQKKRFEDQGGGS